jgi:hypothetical protein
MVASEIIGSAGPSPGGPTEGGHGGINLIQELLRRIMLSIPAIVSDGCRNSSWIIHEGLFDRCRALYTPIVIQQHCREGSSLVVSPGPSIALGSGLRDELERRARRPSWLSWGHRCGRRVLDRYWRRLHGKTLATSAHPDVRSRPFPHSTDRLLSRGRYRQCPATAACRGGCSRQTAQGPAAEPGIIGGHGLRSRRASTLTETPREPSSVFENPNSAA